MARRSRLREEIVDRGEPPLPHLEDDALVAVEPGDAGELVGRDAIGREVDAPRRVGDLPQLG